MIERKLQLFGQHICRMSDDRKLKILLCGKMDDKNRVDTESGQTILWSFGISDVWLCIYCTTTSVEVWLTLTSRRFVFRPKPMKKSASLCIFLQFLPERWDVILFIIIIITSHGLNVRWRPTPASPSSASCFGPVLSGSVPADFYHTTPPLKACICNVLHYISLLT